MDDVLQIALRMAIQTVKITYKVLKPILLWTGLLYPFLLSFGGFLFEIDNIPLWLWVIAWVLCAYTALQNIIRLFKRDKSFKLYKTVLRGSQSRLEKRSTNPRANSSLSFSEPAGAVLGV